MYLEVQHCHRKFEPDKAQYSTPKFFDRLFLIRALISFNASQNFCFFENVAKLKRSNFTGLSQDNSEDMILEMNEMFAKV